MEEQLYTPQPTQQSQYSNNSNIAPVMTVGDWVVTMLIMCIPLANLVMLIVWAVSTTDNPNRKNWAVSQLIFMAIGVLLWIVLAGAIIGLMGDFSQVFSGV